MNPVSKNRLILVGIALMFFLPLMGAVLMQSDWWDYHPQNTTNRGQLLNPTVALELDALPVQHEAAHNPGRTAWTLLLPISDTCDSVCMDAATGLRQIHRASGRHQQDLSVALLSPRPLGTLALAELVSVYPEFRVLADQGGIATRALGLARAQAAGSGAGFNAGSEPAFIVDPAGNIILAYPPPVRHTDINKDLKRLLKYSGEDPS